MVLVLAYANCQISNNSTFPIRHGVTPPAHPVPSGCWPSLADQEGWQLKASTVIYTADLKEKMQAVIEAAHQDLARSKRGNCKVKSYPKLSVPLVHQAVHAVDTQTVAEPDDVLDRW